MAVVTSSTAAAQTDTILVSAPGSGNQISVYGLSVSTDTNESVAFGSGPIKEVTTVDVGAASGGTWTLTVAGNTSGAINYNDNAAAVETAVEGITGVTAATVTGAGTTANPWIITIDDPNGALVISGDGSSLTPSDTLTVTETTAGVDETVKYKLYVLANTTGDVYLDKKDELFRCADNYPLSITTTAAGNTFISVNYQTVEAHKTF